MADHFHLLVNLRDVVQRLLQRKQSCLPKEANAEHADSEETEKYFVGHLWCPSLLKRGFVADLAVRESIARGIIERIAICQLQCSQQLELLCARFKFEFRI
jgi:hypothetical protein